jgi:motility/secretion related protein SprA
LARPSWVLFSFVVLGLVIALRSGSAQTSPDDLPVYRGPVVLYDLDDPLYSTRWTLGNREPMRWLLNLPSNLALHQLLTYETNRGRVYRKYLAGEQEILPPMGFTPAEYADEAFREGLMKNWIKDTGNSLKESRERGGAPEGLINLNLPTLPFASKVFGDGAPNLRVRGSEQITVSGSSSWVVGQVTGEQGGNSLFPKLDMRQRLNVNLDGTIGSKLSVSMAQNSDALTPLENSIKIRYKGLDDEVLKSVELGNTNLSLPSTQFISYSTRQEGLFGVKTEAELGGVSFTAIASREQGQTGQTTFTGGAAQRTITVKDYNYVQGKYFFLLNPNDPNAPVNKIENIEIRLYLDDNTPNNDVEKGAQPARVWLDPKAKTPASPVTGHFHQLVKQDDYTIPNESVFSLPRIELNNPLTPYQTLAVAYIMTVNAVPETVGTWVLPAGGDSTLDLKMLRPRDDQWGNKDLRESPWGEVRYLEAKNIYSLGVHDIEAGSLIVDIVRDLAGDDGQNFDYIDNEFKRRTPLLQLLGLDQKNNISGQRIPDQKIDPEFVDLTNGLIWFPDLRPFDPDVVDIEGSKGGTGGRARSWPREESAARPDTLGWYKDDSTGAATPSPASVRLEEVTPEIYDLRNSELQSQNTQYHKYTIKAQVKAALASSTIQLDTFQGGVLQNSETVRLNGKELRKGEEYTIDYDTGTVTIRDAAALAPNADLVITYSQDALFQRGSHSLFGASISTGQRDPNGKFALSSTWLHESRGVPDRRPRLRGEPMRTTVGDFSGRLQFNPWLLTDLVDKLPLVHANTPSHFELNGAVAMSMPNPNTKGNVYIDDMEGAENNVSPGVNRVNWFYSSTPREYNDHTFLPPPRPGVDPPDPPKIQLRDEDRGELLWFSTPKVVVGDVTPREDSQNTRNDQQPALEVIYIPPDSATTDKAWAGLVTSLGNQDISRKTYLQVWVNDYIPIEDSLLRRGELMIDVGDISEDAVWDPQTPPLPADHVLDFEDKNNNAGQAEVFEDKGLDFEFDETETARREGTKTFSPFTPAQDPAGDNRLQNPDEDKPEDTLTQRIEKYKGINGTEGNQRLDTEDLNTNNNLEVDNNYLEYRIPLSDSAFIDNRRDFSTAGQDANSGWRMYRIPLTKFDLQVGSVPDFSQTKAMRIWFRGIAPGDTLDLQVASIEIVGNNWELAEPPDIADTGPFAEVFNVGVANNKEDAGYVEPVEVQRIDNVKEKEQSISLNFANMKAGSELHAFKRLTSTDDYTLYQSVEFFLNPRFQEIPNDTVEFFMRFGSDATTDASSYYEVATRISQNDPRRNANGWIDVTFNVTDLSNFKLNRSTYIPPDEYLVGPGDAVDSTTKVPRAQLANGLLVTVRGSPSFSRIKRYAVGLRNVSGGQLAKGAVWYDELRMGSVRRDMGYAGTVRASMTLADLADVQGSVSLTNPDFLRLGESKGSGSEDLRYDLRGQVGLHKFLEPLHLIAPLQMHMSRTRATPKFIPNNDILFEGQPSTGNEITQTNDKGMDLTVGRELRGLGHPFMRYTIDALHFSGSIGRTSRDDVTRSELNRRMNASASYNLGLGDISPIRPFGLMSFWLWPRSLQLGLNAGRTEAQSSTPSIDDPTILIPATNSITKTEILTVATTVQPITGLTYSFTQDRDLIGEHFPDSTHAGDRPPLIIKGVDLGRATGVTHNMVFNYTPPLLSRILSPRFTWTSGSNQNMAPNLTLEDYDHPVFDIANSNNTTVSLVLPLGRLTDSAVRRPTGRVIKPNRPGRGEKADTTEVSTKSGQDVSVRQFFTKVLRLRDIQTTGSYGNRSAYSRMWGDPPISYRLGFERDINEGIDVNREANAAVNTSKGRTWSVRGTTSVTLLGQVDVDMSFQKRHDYSDMNHGLTGIVKDDTTWPDLRFDWGDLQKKIPIIRSFSDFRIVNTSFSRETDVVGPLENPGETKTTTKRWSPLISITGTLPGDWKTTMNANISKGQTRSDRSGVITTQNRSQNQYQLSFNKRFIGKGGNSKKDVDVKVDMSYSSNSSVMESNVSRGGLQADKTDQLRMTSSATVRLTTALSGTFGLELGQERRPTSDWTRRSVRVSFTTGFNF